MLKQRVITALVLLAILLPALFYTTAIPFAVLAVVLISAAAWEWARLNGYGTVASLGTGLACVVLCVMSWYLGMLEQLLPLLWRLAGAAWVLAGAWLLRGGVAGWPRIPRVVRLVVGVLALWLAWLAVAQARFIGIEFLLSLLLLVWVADIGAYFAGKGLGGRFSKGKLAPAISPGKSWEGVWGGMVGVLVLCIAWVSLDSTGNSFYARLAAQYGLPLTLLAMIFLAAFSVVGDLVESLVKRSAGAKDSSGLLPGHGGVLDRVDALVPVLPLALMLVTA
ncbi:MAG: phosphatidate cytidylyltransferase [Polaromonas sp.]|uniref:phosphatidate cytidylyltransferase n=1 Tax=Polaromonas sp. TaxID=1869339 RepID=UPI0017D508DA|nr:phosphatidate cytidylyltransferase [Polaromonas sp.]MBA3592307.1 phosphatidate cytidylyltransferase [Polaromonas sp.]